MNRRPNYGSMSDTSDVNFSATTPSEFNSLCDSVVTNIYTINSNWKTLENGLKSIGTSRDNQALRNNIHVTQLSTNQIITVTSKEVSKLKLLMRKLGKQQQLQVVKLEDNFKEALGQYSLLQKQVADKMKANLLTVVQIEYEESSSSQNQDVQQQAQLSRELAHEQDMMLDREARIRQIEADILDVNQIMRELGSLVHQQGEVIDTIENNIDYATGNIEEGTDQLLKASQYQNKYRKKLCCLVLIASIVIIIIIVVLVVELKKSK